MKTTLGTIAAVGAVALLCKKGSKAHKTKCLTPEAQFDTHIQPHQISVTVEYPFLLDLSEEEAKRLEALTHNAMESVLRPYFMQHGHGSLAKKGLDHHLKTLEVPWEQMHFQPLAPNILQITLWFPYFLDEKSINEEEIEKKIEVLLRKGFQESLRRFKEGELPPIPDYDRIYEDFEGSRNQPKEIKVIRTEKKRAGWKPKHHMKSMSSGRLHDPNKIVGATITLEGTDPQSLRNYRIVEPILRAEARKLGLHAAHLLFRTVYQSHRKADTWESKWDLRG